MGICDNCGQEIEILNEIGLFGSDDFYQLEVCHVCQRQLTEDYFPPEQITRMFGGVDMED